MHDWAILQPDPPDGAAMETARARCLPPQQNLSDGCEDSRFFRLSGGVSGKNHDGRSEKSSIQQRDRLSQ